MGKGEVLLRATADYKAIILQWENPGKGGEKKPPQDKRESKRKRKKRQ